MGAMVIAPHMRIAAADTAIAEVTVIAAAAITTVAGTTGAAGTTAVVAVITADSAEDPAAAIAEDPAVAIAVDSAAAAEDSVDTSVVIGDTISGTCLK